MSRKARPSLPGRLYHVVNRGVGRRTIFEGRLERRRFLADLARAVHRGWIRVYAYALLETHYHLLVLDCDGRLSEAIQRAQARYAQRFNLTRERGGAVFQGRFYSRVVEGLRDRENVFRYIEANAVTAGIVAQPADHEFCSAADRVRRRPRPWLEAGLFAPTRTPLSADTIWTVERAMLGPARRALSEGLLDEVHADELEDWVLARARNADAQRPGRIVLGREALARALARCAEPLSQDHVVGLWRLVCGFTLREIAVQVGASRSEVQRRWAAFRAASVGDPHSLAPALALLRRAWRDRV